MEWQPIATLVMDGQQRLFSAPAGIFIAPATTPTELPSKEAAKMYLHDGSWPHSKFIPTHWMPLPAAPV